MQPLALAAEVAPSMRSAAAMAARDFMDRCLRMRCRNLNGHGPVPVPVFAAARWAARAHAAESHANSCRRAVTQPPVAVMNLALRLRVKSSATSPVVLRIAGVRSRALALRKLHTANEDGRN